MMQAQEPRPMMTKYVNLSDLLDFIQCPICYHIFNDPIMLPCRHTVCHECSNRLQPLKCPLDNEPFQRYQLVKDFNKVQLVDLYHRRNSVVSTEMCELCGLAEQEYVCHDCIHRTVDKTNNSQDSETDNQVQHDSAPESQSVSLIEKAAPATISWQKMCVFCHSAHRRAPEYKSHRTNKLVEAVSTYKEQLQDWIKQLDNLDTVTEDVHCAVLYNVQQRMDQLRKEIEDARMDTINKVELFYVEQLEVINKEIGKFDQEVEKSVENCKGRINVRRDELKTKLHRCGKETDSLIRAVMMYKENWNNDMAEITTSINSIQTIEIPQLQVKVAAVIQAPHIPVNKDTHSKPNTKHKLPLLLLCVLILSVMVSVYICHTTGVSVDVFNALSHAAITYVNISIPTSVKPAIESIRKWWSGQDTES